MCFVWGCGGLLASKKWEQGLEVFPVHTAPLAGIGSLNLGLPNAKGAK